MRHDAMSADQSFSRRGAGRRTAETHARGRQARTARLRRRAVAIAAMATVPALAVSLSLPSPSSALAGPAPALQREALSLAPQSFAVADQAKPVDIVRDSYSASAPAPEGAEAYAYTEATFVNDPTSLVQWPFTTGVPVSSPFGYRTPPCPSCSDYHNGVDLTPGFGTPIQAMADGIVTIATDDGGSYGTYMVIQHEIDGQIIESLYAHMIEGSIALEIGERVRVGQLVGLVGSTGLSTGAHLHFEVRPDGEPVDPFVWLPPRVRS